jgi:signal peptidase I
LRFVASFRSPSVGSALAPDHNDLANSVQARPERRRHTPEPPAHGFRPSIRNRLAAMQSRTSLAAMKPASPLPVHRRVIRYLWKEWIRPMALPLLAVAAAKSALADINFVPSGSMKPTILEGDVVFINKLAYDLRVPFTSVRLAQWSDPARGDVVVCFAPDDGTRLVKRVVGLPGDTIELRNEILYVNGTRQSYAMLERSAPGVRDMEPAEITQARFARERLGTHDHGMMVLPAWPAPRDFGPITVPTGHYLMLGDNRDNSRDSRYFGFVARREIVGEAKGVFVSGDKAHWLRPRFNRFFSKLD